MARTTHIEGRSYISARKPRQTAVEIISILFVVLWVYAGLSKLLDYETFRTQLGKSPFLENITGLVALGIPAGELLIAVLLTVPKTRLLGLYASFGLMLLFTGYIYTIMNFSHYIPCACNGILDSMDWNTHFWFNVVFTLLALAGIVLSTLKNDHGNAIINKPS